MSRNIQVTIEKVEDGFTVIRGYPIRREAVAVDLKEALRVSESYFDSGPEDMSAYEKAAEGQKDE